MDESVRLKKFVSDKYPQSVRVLRLSRNFGYQGALWAGLDNLRSEAIVFMDADGEDPPEIIRDFVRKANEGFDVVYGVKQSRKTSFLLNIFYGLFYRVLSFFSDSYINLDAGEFSLVKGQALEYLRKFKDRTRMMRILRAWVGFKQVGVPYDREKRIAGTSKFGFLRSVSFAFDGFVACTDIPYKLALACCFTCIGLAVVGVSYYLWWYFFSGTEIPGFASLNITILVLFGALFGCVAVLSRYVISILNEVRERPPYIVDTEMSTIESEANSPTPETTDSQISKAA